MAPADRQSLTSSVMWGSARSSRGLFFSVRVLDAAEHAPRRPAACGRRSVPSLAAAPQTSLMREQIAGASEGRLLALEGTTRPPEDTSGGSGNVTHGRRK